MSGSDLKIRLGPAGLHLFNRKLGLNLLIDEVLPPRELWASAPRHVSIALTNSCDLKCPYCYAPKTRALLPVEKILAWALELDANGTLGIGFGGGEPTLYRRFSELCSLVSRYTRLAVSFTTHGHHLDSCLLEKLREHVNFVRVSVDGVGHTYERLRGRSYSALHQRLRTLSLTMPFGINYVVNAETLGNINEAVEVAQQLRASEFLLLPERPANGRGGVSAAIKDALVAWTKSYAGALRLAVSEPDSVGMPVCEPLANEAGLRAYAHIDARGEIKGSSYDRKGVVIGSEGVMAALKDLDSHR